MFCGLSFLCSSFHVDYTGFLTADSGYLTFYGTVSISVTFKIEKILLLERSFSIALMFFL